MEYKLVRSKRKTLTISISDGEVTVKAPLRMGIAHIEEFIAQKSAWIQKKLDEYARKTDIMSGVIDGSQAMYHGAFLSVVRSDKHKRIALTQDALFVPAKYEDKKKADSAIAAWYKRTASVELERELKETAERIGHKYLSFATTNARTKWGSCDGNGNIRLNWRLVMLDDGLRTYVIIHELAHTLHHNHSSAFWNEVKKYFPSYAAAKKRLKTFSVLTSLYR
ncbi:MAG: M48 family metallopeptidase [Clostridiales bacterium]|nr:M48 family metallopeptidase [Clostridiales bacterium]